MDLACDPRFVMQPTKSSTTMKLKSNGGTMVVNQKAEVPGHHKKVWFSKDAIANIIALKNLIQQC